MKRDPASFGAVILVTVGVLAALNELPRFLGGEPRGIVRYASIGALEARHGRIWRPAAMPAPWTWPPARIRLAVGDPRWVEFEFASGRDALAICQTIEDRGRALRPFDALRVAPSYVEGRLRSGQASSAPTDGDDPVTLLPAGQLLQAIDTSLAGRDAQLRRVLLDDGTIVHEMWWREGATRMMLRLRGTADRLPAIAAALLGQR